MKRTKSELRAAAANAKTRLKTGYLGREHLMLGGNDDDNFYTQVAACLRAGGNPLVHVLDHEYIATLDESARQRYVLHTSQKVNNCISRFNRVEQQYAI